LGFLGAEAVGFVNEDGGEFPEVAIEERCEFAERFAEEAADAEVPEYVGPGAGVVFVEQVRWGDNEGRLVEVLGEERGHVGFAQTDHVGQEGAAVFLEHLAGVEDGFLLVFQFLEAGGQVHVLDFVGQVEFVPEVLVEEFEVEFAGREPRVGGFDFDGRDVIFGYVHRPGPKLVEFLQGELVVGAILNRNDAEERFISGLGAGFMRSKSQLHGSWVRR